MPSTARARSTGSLTWIASPLQKAPEPSVAVKRSLRTRSWTTPTESTPSTRAAIDTEKPGRSRMKFVVPSIGSMTQMTPVSDVLSAPSSPRSPSSGRASSRTPTIVSSAHRSMAVTMSVGLDFVSMPRSPRASGAARPGATASTAAWASANSSARLALTCRRHGRPRRPPTHSSPGA